MTLNILGITIEVQKKKIKNLHLYVKPPDGRVTISAPLSMSDTAIERFAQIKSAWIKKQIAKFEHQPCPNEYVSGETLYVWGKPYRLRVQYAAKNSLVLLGDTAVLTWRKEITPAQRETFIREWYRKILKKQIEIFLPKWEDITGLKVLSWQTKYMTTRWGTCNIHARRIWLNLQLAKKPPICLEYVILHELTHFVERRHNKKFISFMDRHMPAWREIKAALNNCKSGYPPQP